MRVNPRTVILDALREGPLSCHQIGAYMRDSLAFIRRRVWPEGPPTFGYEHLLDRHLCHLIRNKQVVRGQDGRYRLRDKGMPIAEMRGLFGRVLAATDLEAGDLVCIGSDGCAYPYPLGVRR